MPVVSRLGPHAQCDRMDAARERRFEEGGVWGGVRVEESKNRQRETMWSGEGEIIVDRTVEGSQKTRR